jgi:hypothetical protein
MAIRAVALALLMLAASTASGLAQGGWFVRVCPAKTETSQINLAFTGGGQTAALSWQKGRTPGQLALPPTFDPVQHLKISGQSLPIPGNDDPHADLCVGYGGHIVKQMSFSGSDSTEESATDTDDCGC